MTAVGGPAGTQGTASSGLWVTLMACDSWAEPASLSPSGLGMACLPCEGRGTLCPVTDTSREHPHASNNSTLCVVTSRAGRSFCDPRALRVSVMAEQSPAFCLLRFLLKCLPSPISVPCGPRGRPSRCLWCRGLVFHPGPRLLLDPETLHSPLLTAA